MNRPTLKATLSAEDIVIVKDALSKAVDKVTDYTNADHVEQVVTFIAETILKYRLTYLATPATIESLLDECFKNTINRTTTEELTAHFYINLPDQKDIWDRLLKSLAGACSIFNNGDSKDLLLPESVVENTTSYEQAEMVFAGNSWLVTIAALIAYYDIELGQSNPHQRRK